MSSPVSTPAPRTPVTVTHQEVQYSGPIPPPAMLDQYNRIVPGAAERIIKMAEQQHSHRITLESKVIASDIRNSILGVICAFVITLAVLLLAGYSIHKNQTWAAGFFSVLGIGGLVSTFIYGTQSRRGEREQKAQQKPVGDN